MRIAFLLLAGCFTALNRQGVRQEFSLLSLSIGVVHLRAEACGELDASQLAELASQAKHHAKEIVGGSLYLINGLVEQAPVAELGFSV